MVRKIKEKFANFTPKDYRRYFYHLFLVILGNILLAFGTAAFLVSKNLVAGGLSGIAIIIQSFLPDAQVIDIIIAIMSWTLFLIGLIFLGKKFTFQTLVSTIVYPIALSIIYRVIDTKWLNNALPGEMGILLAGIFGGVFIGTGCAITFRGGGSTGGLDVIAFIMQKYLKIKCSVGAFILDALIIVIGFFTTENDLLISMIGIISAYVSAMMIEKIFITNSTSYVAQIISKKWEAINEYIITNLERGTTIINSEGGYEHAEYRMIQVAFDRKEYAILMDAINHLDAKAFVTIIKAHEINGLGFNSFPKKKI